MQASVGRERMAWIWITPGIFLAAGLYFIALAQTGYFSGIPGDIGDARFNSVILEHLYRWAIGLDGSLWSPEFFYPARGALSFSDNHFGTAIIYIGARLAGLDRYAAFDAWYVIGYAVSFLAAHFSLRRFGFGPLASAAGAFVFAFAPPVSVQYGHAQLIYRWAIPLAMLAWWQWTRRGSLQKLGYCALLVCIAFYSSIYLGYFLVLTLATFAIGQYVVAAREDRAHLFRQLAGRVREATRGDVLLAGVLIFGSLVLTALLFLPYLHYGKLYGFARGPGEIASLLPRPGSYLLADHTIWHVVSAKVTGVPSRGETQMFFGLSAWILAVIGLYAARRHHLNWIKAAAIAVALLAILTVSVGDQSLYLLLAKLPGANAIRAVGRIVLVMLFPVSILVAGGVQALVNKAGGAKAVTWSAAGLLLVLMLAESCIVSTPVLSRAEAQQRVVHARSRFPAELPAGAILFLPIDQPFYASELDAMLVGQETGHPTLNGYSGNAPRGYGSESDSDPCSQAFHRVWGAEHIPLHRPGFDIRSFAGSIVLADGVSCSILDLTTTEPPLTPSLMALTKIKILGLRVNAANHVQATIKVRNGGDHPLLNNARSAPVNLSWQWIAPGAKTSESDWQPRFSVAPGVPPGGWRDFDVDLGLARPGDHQIVFSMVQDGVRWFHDAGMLPVTSNSVIRASVSGATRIDGDGH